MCLPKPRDVLLICNGRFSRLPEVEVLMELIEQLAIEIIKVEHSLEAITQYR